MEVNQITLVMAYYNNGGMLDLHQKEWAKYPMGYRALIVDDGSRRDPAEDHARSCPLALDLYRVRKDIPWNQNGARNLAMKNVRTEWCVITDMDMMLTADMAYLLQRVPVHKGVYYTFGRKKAADSEYKESHPNTYLIHRDDFWDVGGYDEDFCGYYGSDSVFRRALEAWKDHVHVPDIYFTLYGREVQPDASTTDYGRKGTEYHSMLNPFLRMKRKKCPYKAKDHIRFEWEKVI